jgi:hypothetical protein
MSTAVITQVATFDEWYRMAIEFFRVCDLASREQIDAGQRTLVQALIGLKQQLSTVEQVRAGAILMLASKKLLRAEMECSD